MTMETAGVLRTCVNHPGVETRLTCSSCDDPICPRCMVTTAVGQKCPRCARQSGRAKGVPELPLVARAFGVGLVAAAVLAYLLLVIQLVGLLLAAVYGYVVGSAVRWGARRRTHPSLGVAAAAAVLLGFNGVALALGAAPVSPVLLLVDLLGGIVAYGRAAGRW